MAVDRQRFVTIATIGGTMPSSPALRSDRGPLAKVVTHDQTVQRSATPTPLTRAGGRIVSLRMVRENAPRARK